MGGSGKSVPTATAAGTKLKEVDARVNADTQQPQPMQVHPCDF